VASDIESFGNFAVEPCHTRIGNDRRPRFTNEIVHSPEFIDLPVASVPKITDQTGRGLFSQYGKGECSAFLNDVGGKIIFVATDPKFWRMGSYLEYGIGNITRFGILKLGRNQVEPVGNLKKCLEIYHDLLIFFSIL